MIIAQDIVCVVCHGVAAYYRMVGETDINALERLVQESAVFHQQSVVEGVNVMTLIVKGYIAVFEVASHKLVVVADPLTVVVINEVFVAVEVGG